MTPIYFVAPIDFRTWLERNHAEVDALLVGFHKKGTGQPSLTWPESVDEALCFGWLDGVRRNVDARRYSIRFTPRRAASIWSSVNVARVQALMDQGRMRPAGIVAFDQRQANRSGIDSHEQLDAALTGSDLEVFQANTTAWEFFQAQPTSYRKAVTWWVVSAKQATTRQTRLARAVASSAHGERLPTAVHQAKAGGLIHCQKPITGQRRATSIRRTRLKTTFLPLIIVQYIIRQIFKKSFMRANAPGAEAWCRSGQTAPLQPSGVTFWGVPRSNHGDEFPSLGLHTVQN